MNGTSAMGMEMGEGRKRELLVKHRWRLHSVRTFAIILETMKVAKKNGSAIFRDSGFGCDCVGLSEKDFGRNIDFLTYKYERVFFNSEP